MIRERFCASKDKKKCPGVDDDGIQTETKRCDSEECNGKITKGPGTCFSKDPVNYRTR